jgi:hypothetical protein
MRRNIFYGLAIVTISLWGCEEEGPEGNNNPGGNNPKGNNKNVWLIPQNEVFDGGPGKDGIPALTEPKFIEAGEAEYVDDDDLVLGFVVGSEARAYPHSILDWHEIINDKVGNVNISVTYCPLTGTGIGWNRNVGGKVTTFGVSGLLYNSNLIPYDRESDSNWSQIRLDCVNGELSGTEIETYNLVETTWKTWKEMYPDTKVVSTATGYTRNYGAYPYGSYRTNHEYLIFPVANEDNRMNTKDRVHGVVLDGTARIYPLSQFRNGVQVIQDVFRHMDLVIVGNETDNFVVSFKRNPGDGTLLSFSAVQDKYPVVMTDQEGNMWDAMGTAVSGPRKGTRLEHARSFMGYWFSFIAFYPGLTIHGEL